MFYFTVVSEPRKWSYIIRTLIPKLNAIASGTQLALVKYSACGSGSRIWTCKHLLSLSNTSQINILVETVAQYNRNSKAAMLSEFVDRTT
jgi:hypothetical protein